MSTRPKVTNPARPADNHHLPGERIIEFSDSASGQGGLIAFHRVEGNDGRWTLRVCLYRLDDDVEVIAPAANLRLGGGAV